MAEEVPAGWYPTPDGKQKYWDGEKWTSLPWDGEVLDEVATDPKRTKRMTKRRKIWFLSIGAIVIVAAIGAGAAWKVTADAETERELAHAAAVEKAEKNAEEAERREEAEERKDRELSVESIEASVKGMAEGHAKDDVIDGPIISASCSPLGGGSTDDLSEKTTVFTCFVANKDNGDGTLSGYTYSATMNWTTGEYSYGLGS